jgi:hypothetical protein
MVEHRRAVILLAALALAFPELARASGATWSELGPALGGRLDGIVASPADPNVLLVASPGGGVWRTSQGGGNWQPVSYGLADYSVFHLEWDRIRPDQLFAVTWSDLYASTDLGDTWTNLTGLGGYPAPLMPSDHGTDPKPFAQLKFSDSQSVILWGKPCSGLFYSYDGVTFTQHWPFSGGASNPENCLQAIAADDLTGRVYFSSMGWEYFDPAHVYVSTCAWTATTPCLTWQLANTNLPTGVIATSLAWTGAANRLAAAMPESTGSVNARVFVTLDGNTWAPTSALPDARWDPRPLASPGLDQLFLGTVVTYQTTDLGSTWSSLAVPYEHADTRAVFWHTYDPSHSYLWTANDGAGPGYLVNMTRWNWVLGSAPSGGTAVSYAGLRVWQPYYVAVTAQHTLQGRPRIFLGTQDNDGVCSDDRGATWGEAGAPPSMGCGDYGSLVFAPSNPNRAYARTCSASVARTDNAVSARLCNDVVWTEVDPAVGVYPPALWTRAMTAVHPTDPDRVYFARVRDVAISTDAGNTLTPSVEFPGGGAQPVSVYVDAAGDIYAGTLDKGVFLSTDDGGSWTPWALNSPAPRAVMNIAYSSAAGGTFFLATTDGLYRLVPGGSWTLVTGGGGYTVSDVEVDPGCPNRVYAAFGFVGALGVHRGGVSVSTDNGTTWSSITSGLSLHQAPIPDVQVDPSDSRFLYAAVYGQGAWQYDQGSTPPCPPLIDTPTPTITRTPIPTPTATWTATVIPTATRTPSLTPTATATHTPSPTASETPTATAAARLSATPTDTAPPSATPTNVATASETPTVAVTATPTEVQQPTDTPTLTPSAVPTETPTSVPATPTATAAPTVCVGDCNGVGTVSIDDLLTMINIALGNAPRSNCAKGDANGDGRITVDEILTAVNNALNGCPVAASSL